MDEAFQLDAGLAADVPDLFESQLAGQDHAREADVFPESHPLGGRVVHLRAGDQRQRRQVQLQQPHILDDQAVHARVIELVDHLLRRAQLVIAEQRVQGHVDPRVVLVREVRDLLDRG